jgi:NAD-dependent dihydropyrimidine dehydrogenase PreA subunit
MCEKQISIYKLAKHLGYPDSASLKKILDSILTKDEAEWMVHLPDNPKHLAAKIGGDKADLAIGLKNLFMRGLVLISEQSIDGPIYIVDDNPGRFMDMVLFDPRYHELGEAFVDLWRKFFNEELVFAPRSSDELPFRVIPVEEKIEVERAILPFESVSQIIQNATRIAVQNCPCRTRERRCESPLETCISLNETAEYMLNRQIGREISVDKAMEILKTCEEVGLVHETDNTDHPTIICNCCSCCCIFLRAITFFQQEDVVSHSRFFAQIDQSKCKSCQTCISRCKFSAISMTSQGAAINPMECYGCGLCTSTCPENAIKLIIREAADFIPHDGNQFMQGLTQTPSKK